MLKSSFILCLLFVVLAAKPGRGQDIYQDTAFLNTPDSIRFFKSLSTKDPDKAALYSAVLPGLGQAYNGDYWKIPVIYSGFMVLGHLITVNNRHYNQFRSALIAEADNNLSTNNPFIIDGEPIFNEASLLRNRDFFRRNRDYLMIWAGVLYLLNIAEAHIAAHLKEFEINEALSMNLSPQINAASLISRSVGVSITLNF